jgi:hypothetical protein
VLSLARRNVAPKSPVEVLDNDKHRLSHRINLLRLLIAHFFRTTAQAYSRSIMRTNSRFVAAPAKTECNDDKETNS